MTVNLTNRRCLHDNTRRVSRALFPTIRRTDGDQDQPSLHSGQTRPIVKDKLGKTKRLYRVLLYFIDFLKSEFPNTGVQRVVSQLTTIFIKIEGYGSLQDNPVDSRGVLQSCGHGLS